MSSFHEHRKQATLNSQEISPSSSLAVNLAFKLQYHTAFGSNVCITGNHRDLGEWDNPVLMKYTEAGVWSLELDVAPSNEGIEYKYLIVEGNANTLWEGGENRRLDLSEMPVGVPIEVRDTWRDISSPEATYFGTSLFREAVFHRSAPATPAAPLTSNVSADHVTVRFEVVCSTTPPKGKMFVSGSCTELGTWSINKAIEMSDAEFPYWRATLVISRAELPFTYKYFVVDETRTKYRWEEGPNRGGFDDASSALGAPTMRYTTSPSESARVLLFNDYEFRTSFRWRGAGVAVPIFSLRTNDGLGIGEFLDLKKMVDLAVKLGLNIIQILPINDTMVFKDYRDSYPYSALSVHALHPAYLNVDVMTSDKAILAEIDKHRKTLNALTDIDYEEVVRVKMDLFKRIFDATRASLSQDAKFTAFVGENKDWLAPYALFCHFRDHYKTTDYTRWGQHSSITRGQIDTLTSDKSPFHSSILFSYFLQYHLDKQLLEASQYAAAHRVGLKGDLPIGVNRMSVDTWVNPHLFRMDMSTGAPPDAFSADGQNWGFPTYAWDVMAKDGYAWWKSRLGQMQKYFHAFRIDHILGFFRIWEIPGNQVTGLLGRFSPSIPLWRWELSNVGVQDFERLCAPYIRTHHVNEIFGGDAPYVIQHFLDEYQPFCFHLKPEFATEKAVVTNLKEDEKRFKSGLFRLIQNVLLLRHPGEGLGNSGDRFYPRIELYKTPSFLELDDHLKEPVRQLYVSYFYERQEEEWRQIGLHRLPAIKNATKMLVCGEDLGMVPKCVEPVLNQLGILGLRIQRMPADPKIEFYRPSEYQYLTVCTTSSHDMTTLRGWWEDDRDRSQRMYNDVLMMFGKAPYFCEAYVTQSVLHHHLHSPSMWAIFPIQDFMGLSAELAKRHPKEEKINEPSDPLHYWRYRMHVGIDELLTSIDHQSWIDGVRFLVQSSGRTLNF